MPSRPPANPFRFGALARDESFTDRDDEIAELLSDARNGQDVVIFAPRRFGKTSLVDRVQQRLVSEKVLVGQINLMKAPTKEKLASKLARAIHDDIASPLFNARERLRVFSTLRISPTITVDAATGETTFTFSPSARSEDIDATLERLLELPAQLAAERERRVENTRNRSLALKSGEATSSWIARASLEASFSFVGAFIRSTSATRTPSCTSPCAARRRSDDFP